jgi:hypothetical protein
MHAHEVRVVEERRELADRLDRLEAFLGGDTFMRLEEGERELLERQARVMREYVDVLDERIRGFGG